MLTVVTFLWKPMPGYRSKFTSKNVDTLFRMVKRNLDLDFRFVCITDQPETIREKEIEVFELWDDFADVKNPSGSKNPSCYRRLRLFAPDVASWLGDRFVVMDLDCVVTGDLGPLFARQDDFIIWKSTTPGNFYNGSLWMMDAGARPQVWRDFDPVQSPILTSHARLYGSDQAWFAYKLGGGESTWSAADGVYSMRNQIAPGGGKLPTGARLVFFHGKGDPWDEQMQRLPWVAKNYR